MDTNSRLNAEVGGKIKFIKLKVSFLTHLAQTDFLKNIRIRSLFDKALFFLLKYGINKLMMEYPIHFNRSLLHKHKNRSLFISKGNPHHFILNLVTDNIIERLLDIQKSFPLALIYGDYGLLTSKIKRHPILSKKIKTYINANMTFQQCQYRQPTSPSLCYDEEYLPIKEKEVDVLITILSLHWINDLPGALIQARKILKPDGLFIAVLFGENTLMELGKSLLTAELKHQKSASIRIAPFITIRDGAHLLQRAGFALPVSDIDQLIVNYKNPDTLIKDLRHMGETSVLTPTALPIKKTVFNEAMSLYKKNFSIAPQTCKAQFNMLYLTGWAPHPDQQKPLRPNSAQKRLADALNTKEYNS